MELKYALLLTRQLGQTECKVLGSFLLYSFGWWTLLVGHAIAVTVITVAEGRSAMDTVHFGSRQTGASTNTGVVTPLPRTMPYRLRPSTTTTREIECLQESGYQRRHACLLDARYRRFLTPSYSF